MVGPGEEGGSQDALKSRISQASAAAWKGRYDEAWGLMQLRPVARFTKLESQCVSYSSGDVRQFFTRTPCRSLERALLVVRSGQGTIAVSVAWVRMPTVADAAQVKQLVDKLGTGYISPIAGSVLKLGDIRFSDTHYSSRRSGTLVVFAEAEQVNGQVAAYMLDAVTYVAVELPPL